MQGRMAGAVAVLIGVVLAAATSFGVVTSLKDSASTQSDQALEQAVMDYGTNISAP